MFGQAQIEDLWIPCFCVSTNLTRGERMVHERGPLWRAVRASLAIPGEFTPVPYEGDDRTRTWTRGLTARSRVIDGLVMSALHLGFVRQ